MNNTYIPLEAGKIYHIYNRGNNRENLFKKAENYPYFLHLWQRHISPIAQTYAYCLLPNHIHFCVRMREMEELPADYADGKKRLTQAFSNCFNAYSKAINKRYGRVGSLFQKNFHRKEVKNERYLLQLINYIHLNPHTHGIWLDFSDYPYSSYGNYDRGVLSSLHCQDVMEYFGGLESFRRFHRKDLPGFENLEGLEEEKLEGLYRNGSSS